MIFNNCEIVVMKKLFRIVTFAVYNDGTYQQIDNSGSISDFAFDFADMFIRLSADGYKVVRR